MTKRILIAEDEYFLGKIMKFSLEENGYTVHHTDNGEGALNYIKKNNYSIILLDLMMPKKDGFEVLKELKKMQIKVPVLVFSNLSQEEDKKEALALGARGYYVKSDIAIDSFVEEVGSYLK